MSQNELTLEDEENIKSLVSRRLVECGWKDEVSMLCKEKLMYRLSKGQLLTSIDVDDLFDDVALEARRRLPDTIKRELKVKVQNNLLEASGYFDETDSET